MGASKSRGSLRDFRVDSISGSSDLSTCPPNQQKDSQTLPQQRPSMNQALPQQRPSMRQSVRQSVLPTSTSVPTSTVQEWDHDDSGLDQSKLWKAWEEDLEITRVEAAAPTFEKPISQESPAMTSAQVQEKEVDPAPKRNLPWAAELALTERRMERRGEVEYSNSFKKQELLKIQTSEYIRVLRTEFSRSIDMFNEARQSGAHAAHLYNISGTEDDFMLFRNGVKLVVSGQRSGRILFVFNQFLGQVFAPNQNPQVELEAQWGPFDRLFWSYRGERVQVQDVVRYFVSEFIRQSYK